MLRDPHTGQVNGMLLLYVDDGCFGGKGQHFEATMEKTLKRFNIGKLFEGEFEFLGRHVNSIQISILKLTWIVTFVLWKNQNPNSTTEPARLKTYCCGNAPVQVYFGTASMASPECDATVGVPC